MPRTAAAFSLDREDRGAIRVLTMNRPGTRNAFTAEGYQRLRLALEEADAEESVSVCVLTGAGRAFSSGVDLAELDRPRGARELGATFGPLIERLARFAKPLVAAVNGSAVGFGATLLLHCDLLVVDESAEISFPFARLGTCIEAGGSLLLPRRVGMQQAAWLTLSGQPIGAGDAVRSGLAQAEAARGEALSVAVAMAAAIARNPLPALVTAKALLREGWSTAIATAWERERSAMGVLAERIGPLSSARQPTGRA